MIRLYFMFGFLFFSVLGVFADIFVLHEIDPQTGKRRVIEGRVSERRDRYFVTLLDNTSIVVEKKDVYRKFRNRRRFEKYIEEDLESYETYLELEHEVIELREKLKEVTGNKKIEIRMSPCLNKFEFYQFETRLDRKREILDALKENLKATREFEKLYDTYLGFNTMTAVGISLTVASMVVGAALGATVLGLNVPDRKFPDFRGSDDAFVITGAVCGGVCAAGIGLWVGGVSGRIYTRMKFVEPIRYYNNCLEKEKKMPVAFRWEIGCQF